MKAKVALGLGGQNAAQIAQLTQNIITAMTGNPNFGTPSPALTDVQAQLTATTAKINAYEAAADAAKTALAERDDSERVLCALLTSLGAYVDNVSSGDETIILSAGMPVKSGRTPVAVGQVQNLRLTASDASGEIFADWDREAGTLVYRVQISTDTATPPTNWVEKLRTSKAKCTLNHDLVSGTKVWVRVCAVGARNEGPWSEMGWKTVP